jgi:hypothetical protein
MTPARMHQSALPLLTRLLGLLALLPTAAAGFSQGSPICEVNTLPLTAMSPTLADPAPQGWSLQLPDKHAPGRAVQIRVINGDPTRRARGVLLWVKSGPAAGAGSFSIPGSGLWQYVPPPVQCGTWAIAHTDGSAKTQDQLVFEWTSSEAISVIVRAFVIEDCTQQGGCRDQQALTPIGHIDPALFFDGFEPPLPFAGDSSKPALPMRLGVSKERPAAPR